MKINFRDIVLNVEIFSRRDGFSRKNNSGNLILFLHGFTGSSEDWKNIAGKIDKRFSLAALDLIGHGKSQSPEDENFYSAGSISEQIKQTAAELTDKKIILVGYSMGGRAALSFASKYHEKIHALILESTSPGITSENLRADRVRSDEELAKFILKNPIEIFVDRWMNIDLFNSQKNLPRKILKSEREKKLRNNPVGLANSLKGFGSGKMPPLFDKLENINIKTLLISGELDKKFTTINNNMLKFFPFAENHIIKGAGHNTHLEKPDDFTTVVNNFLKKF